MTIAMNNPKEFLANFGSLARIGFFEIMIEVD